ncbi:hypothetical protein EV421DRAFT_612562 [Armillaria borealis]|uniref:Secreted protein n=1 Tax=Armillaria borealis TaxID=47425 RepID=A0AA39JGC5_9AGAR|nr:hypothetical protein EV421DRAFT_612562 [Armillaria borealis]
MLSFPCSCAGSFVFLLLRVMLARLRYGSNTRTGCLKISRMICYELAHHHHLPWCGTVCCKSFKTFCMDLAALLQMLASLNLLIGKKR